VLVVTAAAAELERASEADEPDKAVALPAVAYEYDSTADAAETGEGYRSDMVLSTT
jgi:hypothetical protein